ncbi:hypothetical protein V7968_31820 [Nocardia vulneris]|uniref:hypothetical protein n=1 Tax=Nocardia vulneris TaxID=1141657 RepID=UPI0030CCC409
MRIQVDPFDHLREHIEDVQVRMYAEQQRPVRQVVDERLMCLLDLGLVAGAAQAITHRLDEVGGGDQSSSGELQVSANRRSRLKISSEECHYPALGN